MKDTIEGNKLIAEFDKGENISFVDDFYKSGAAIKVKGSLYPYHKLEYHTSWDWLMPVVEKISRITIEWENSDDRTDTYYPRTFGMLNSETGNPMVRINRNAVFEAETLIEATWLAVVEFIKYLNNQKNKP